MYKEIHPLYFDRQVWMTVNHEQSERPKQKAFYKKAEPRLINLACIRQIRPEMVLDESIKLVRICISDDHLEDITVSQKEGDEIKKILMEGSVGNDPLAEEVKKLTKTVRDLTELLRARLH